MSLPGWKRRRCVVVPGSGEISADPRRCQAAGAAIAAAVPRRSGCPATVGTPAAAGSGRPVRPGFPAQRAREPAPDERPAAGSLGQGARVGRRGAHCLRAARAARSGIWRRELVRIRRAAAGLVMASLAAVIVNLWIHAVDAAADLTSCRDDSSPPTGQPGGRQSPELDSDDDHIPCPPLPRLPVAARVSLGTEKAQTPGSPARAPAGADPPGPCPSRHARRAGLCPWNASCGSPSCPRPAR
jgi:hypothetical protein